MRKETQNKQVNTLKNTSGVQSYHRVSTYEINYAFQGYQDNYYYTSDRKIKLNANWEREDGKPLKGYGLEIETESSAITGYNVIALVLNNLILKQFDNNLFKLQCDGSLNHNRSAEIITQVMTKENIRNNYPKWKDLFNTFKSFGFSAYDSGNCGMHCNISNALFGTTEEIQKKNIRKFFKMINYNYNSMSYILYRKNNPNSSTTFCAKMSVSNYETVDVTSFGGGSHYYCFNFSHYNEGRIECRLVGGQKDYASFRNTMETIFFLVERSKTISFKGCENINEIFKGCNQYVVDRIRGFKDYIKSYNNELDLDLIISNSIREDLI